MNFPTELRLVLAPFLLLLLTGAPARAEETAVGPSEAEQCLTAHENVQVDRASGDLLAAREALAVCVRATCPEIVRRDCAVWYQEVTREQPSVVVTATQGDRDLVEGEVFVDDVRIEQGLSGKTLLLNPGRHVVRLEIPGQAPLEKVVVLTTGETGRRVHFELVSPTKPGDDKGPAPAAAVATTRPIPTVTYVLAGTSAVALLTGATFGVIGLTEKNGLTCAPFCAPEQKDSVDTKFLVADIAFGVGAAAGIVALVTYLVRPEVPVADAPAKSSSLTPVLTGDLAYLSYQGAF